MTIGESIKRCREEAGLSQLALGVELGCSQGQVSDWELGYHYPNWKFIKRLVEFFGLYVITDALEESY